MIRRKVSEEQVRQRELLERELGAIPALSPAARKLLSAEGFLDYFLKARALFPTYEDAYYFLEEQHERLTGEWMYSEYDSFRAVYKRWLKRQKKESRSSP